MNKYEELCVMTSQVLARIGAYRDRLKSNREYAKMQKKLLENSIDEVQESLDNNEYVLFVLKNFKSILMDTFKEVRGPAIIFGGVLFGVLSIALKAFSNPAMLWTTIGISVGSAVVGAGIEFLVDSWDIIKIHKNNDLSKVTSENNDLKQALEIKRSDLKSLTTSEEKIAAKLVEVESDYELYRKNLENVFANHIIASSKCNGNEIEINSAFDKDDEIQDIAKLTRTKLEEKEQ